LLFDQAEGQNVFDVEVDGTRRVVTLPSGRDWRPVFLPPNRGALGQMRERVSGIIRFRMRQHDLTGENLALPHTLRMWDAVSLIVGITVGTAIFRSPTLVFQNTATAWGALGIWLVGGGLCFLGGLCYAELATTYPRNGGDYEYLRRAYGRGVGFLFGWAMLSVVATGNIGAMAYAFADYSRQVWPIPEEGAAWVAAVAILVISAANLLGAVAGRSLQNLLTSTKVIGLGGVVVAGLFLGLGTRNVAEAPATGSAPSIGLALVFVLYAFGGWNDGVLVAAEVRDQRRSLPRALLLGILGISIIYLAVNAAYLAALGFEGARSTATPAAAVLQVAVGPWGARVISVLVMISALGAINGMILAHSRIYATVGEDHPVFAFLGKWSRRRAPVTAILVQLIVALAMVFAVGTSSGRKVIDAALSVGGLARVPWDAYFGGFETLVAGSAPVFWAFFLLSGISVFVLRVRDGQRARPFHVPFFPVPPLVFCATCAAMLYSSLAYAGWLAVLGAVPLTAGVALFLLDRALAKRAGAPVGGGCGRQ
jgi:APA family basic amino acid/polyamine antiporter